MKTMNLFVLLSIVTAQLVIQGQAQDTCGNALVKPGEKYQLKHSNDELKLEFDAQKNCEFEVTGYKMMEFTTAISEIDLQGNNDCSDEYVAVDAVKENLGQKPEIKACTKTVPQKTVTSKNQAVFVKVQIKNAGAEPKPTKRTVTFKFTSIQKKECGLSPFTLTSPRQTVKYPVDATMFQPNTICNIAVNGINKRAFTMSVKQINLSAGNCINNYFAADVKEISEVPEDKRICKIEQFTQPISAPAGMLYLQIVKTEELKDSGVTLEFVTDYSECGNLEIQVNGTKDVSLPPEAHPFKDDTLCTIKVAGVNEKNFKLTITNISFPTGTCENDYVSAAAKENELPNPSYRKCGDQSVTEPFESTSGVMYVQIKTSNAKSNPKVTLHFESGAVKHGQISFLAIFVITLVTGNL